MTIRGFAIAFITIGILSALTGAQQPSEEVVKVDTELVNIPVVVSDRNNRYIPGLTKNNFRIFKDGSEQRIDLFSNELAPMSVVLALDTSLSTKPVLGKIKKAAKEFVEDLGREDRCMIVTFDFSVRELSTLTSDKDALGAAIKKAKVGSIPGTVLNDAVYQAVRDTLRPIKGRKAVIVLTDGKDFGSDLRQIDLLDRLAESDTVIYPIYYETEQAAGYQRPGPFPRAGRFPGGMGRGGMGRFPGGMGRGGNWPGRSPKRGDNNAAAEQFLQRLADITGGRLINRKDSDLSEAFAQIADEMKRQYLLGFYPLDQSQAGTVHRVSVKVDRPDASVRSKSEYKTQSK